MDFLKSYGLCDIVQSSVFEGLGYGYDYTPDQLRYINQTVLETLILPMAVPVSARNMYVSKQLRLPLNLMSRYVGGEQKSNVKYLSYSTHDWTVAQMVLFFNADNDQLAIDKDEVVPFASHTMIELHSSEFCTNEDCFWVEVHYNGKLLEFSENCKEAARCTYPEFMQLL